MHSGMGVARALPIAGRNLSGVGALFLLLPLVLFGDASSVFYLFNGREQMLKSRWRGGGGRREVAAEHTECAAELSAEHSGEGAARPP